ncbi:MAG: trypsin-like peptidase domain-containing protein, partial [Eubacteriales bacterium]
FKTSQLTGIGVNGHPGSGTSYQITLSTKCSVALFEYSVKADFCKKDGTVLESYEDTIAKEVSANTTITVSAKITYETYSNVDHVNATFTGKSRTAPTKTDSTSYTVTLVTNNGTSDQKVSVKKGDTLPTPTDPVKYRYIFTGWYTGEHLSTRYDFSKPVTSDLTLYAGYELDATAITNAISRDTIKSIVKIYNTSYNTFMGIETSKTVSQGSGFCFFKDNGYCYILTNCHVARKDDSYDKQKFSIEDYKGNTYTGYLYRGENRTVDAISPDYDLACLYFKSSSTEVKALSIAQTNPSIYDDLISLGAPRGQTNYITYGTIGTYRTIQLYNTSKLESNVTFPVIEHSAYIDSGSSGGPVLDVNLNVIGVNYAGNDKTQSSYSYSYAVPAEKVNEFLIAFVWS